MLFRIGSKQFRRWQAWFRVREYEAWQRAGTIAAATHNAALIAKGVTDSDAFVGPDFFIPKRFLFPLPKPQQTEPSGDALQSVLAATYGPKY